MSSPTGKDSPGILSLKIKLDSRASIAETLSHAYVALDQGYIVEADMENFKQQADFVWRKINNLISYLNKNNQ